MSFAPESSDTHHDDPCGWCCCNCCGPPAPAPDEHDGVFEEEHPHSPATLAEISRLSQLGIANHNQISGRQQQRQKHRSKRRRDNNNSASASAASIAPHHRSMRVVPGAAAAAAAAADTSSISSASSTATLAPTLTPVKLNVYHLIEPETNAKLLKWGVGIFHSAVVISGREYSFGIITWEDEHNKRTGDPTKDTGVFMIEPGTAAGTLFKTLDLGGTFLSAQQIETLIARLKVEYKACVYAILGNNCNSFCAEFCRRLSTKGNVLQFPAWVNRLASSGDKIFPRRFAAWAVSRYVQGPEEETQKKQQEELQAKTRRQQEAEVAESLAAISFAAAEFDLGGGGGGGAIEPIPLGNSNDDDEELSDVVVTPCGSRWTLHNNGDVSIDPPSMSAEQQPPSAAAASSNKNDGDDDEDDDESPSTATRVLLDLSQGGFIPRVHRSGSRVRGDDDVDSSNISNDGHDGGDSSSRQQQNVKFEFDRALSPEFSPAAASRSVAGDAEQQQQEMQKKKYAIMSPREDGEDSPIKNDDDDEEEEEEDPLASVERAMRESKQQQQRSDTPPPPAAAAAADVAAASPGDFTLSSPIMSPLASPAPAAAAATAAAVHVDPAAAADSSSAVELFDTPARPKFLKQQRQSSVDSQQHLEQTPEKQASGAKFQPGSLESPAPQLPQNGVAPGEKDDSVLPSNKISNNKATIVRSENLSGDLPPQSFDVCSTNAVAAARVSNQITHDNENEEEDDDDDDAARDDDEAAEGASDSHGGDDDEKCESDDQFINLRPRFSPEPDRDDGAESPDLTSTHLSVLQRAALSADQRQNQQQQQQQLQHRPGQINVVASPTSASTPIAAQLSQTANMKSATNNDNKNADDNMDASPLRQKHQQQRQQREQDDLLSGSVPSSSAGHHNGSGGLPQPLQDEMSLVSPRNLRQRPLGGALGGIGGGGSGACLSDLPDDERAMGQENHHDLEAADRASRAIAAASRARADTRRKRAAQQHQRGDSGSARGSSMTRGGGGYTNNNNNNNFCDLDTVTQLSSTAREGDDLSMRHGSVTGVAGGMPGTEVSPSPVRKILADLGNRDAPTATGPLSTAGGDGDGADLVSSGYASANGSSRVEDDSITATSRA